MKKTGAQLVRFALEQLGVKRTFGIPGVHNTEIYDELDQSEHITPVLVAHECGGAFMADAISRTSDETGTLVIVPAAGASHAASGIGEAGIDGIPMLVISGGIHSTSGRHYQLHAMDQHSMLAPLTKGTWLVRDHREVIPFVYEAWALAHQGEPGPVFVEIPYNISNFLGDVEDMPVWLPARQEANNQQTAIDQAAEMLLNAEQPGFFVGWGAVDAQESLKALALLLDAPVATTLQGLSAFPGDHPLHTGMGMGNYAVPAASRAFAKVDCLLAVGTRFAEIPTGSYGIHPPENLIHLDINPAVFNANYPARCTLEGDARQLLPALLEVVRRRRHDPPDDSPMAKHIERDKQAYQDEWLAHDSGDRVNPARFFAALRRQLQRDAIVVADDGNHTFLTAELMPILRPRGFIAPSDFNAMGYCVPAVIGARMVNPQTQVVGIVGDGALLMTGTELITAARLGIGACIFVFNDGELSQIAQAQQLPYNRKTCTRLQGLKLEPFAESMGVDYLCMPDNLAIETVISEALAAIDRNQPVLVEVNVDYSKSTRFTRGVVKTNLQRMALRDKVRVVGRALVRRVKGQGG